MAAMEEETGRGRREGVAYVNDSQVNAGMTRKVYGVRDETVLRLHFRPEPTRKDG